MIEIPRTPDFHKHFTHQPPGTANCIVCGKPIKNEKIRWWLATWDGFYAVTAREAVTLNPAGDSGGWPVGDNCLRKHPELREYVWDARSVKHEDTMTRDEFEKTRNYLLGFSGADWGDDEAYEIYEDTLWILSQQETLAADNERFPEGAERF